MIRSSIGSSRKWFYQQPEDVAGPAERFLARRYRKFLTDVGCKCVRTKGGHEHWTRQDLNRPITLQSHIDPVPEFIVRQHLRYLDLSREEFQRMLDR